MKKTYISPKTEIIGIDLKQGILDAISLGVDTTSEVEQWSRRHEGVWNADNWTGSDSWADSDEEE